MAFRTLESGAKQTLFYAEVTDSMKASEGGGNREEQEEVQAIYIPVERAKEILLYDETQQRLPDLMFSVLWFFEAKCKRK